jgi:hypothetical protein
MVYSRQQPSLMSEQLGKIEPGIMSNILARIDKPARDGLRAATNAYRTLVNSCVTTVHVGRTQHAAAPSLRRRSLAELTELPTTELACIFPNAESLHLSSFESVSSQAASFEQLPRENVASVAAIERLAFDQLAYAQLASTSGIFLGRLRSLTVRLTACNGSVSQKKKKETPQELCATCFCPGTVPRLQHSIPVACNGCHASLPMMQHTV